MVSIEGSPARPDNVTALPGVPEGEWRSAITHWLAEIGARKYASVFIEQEISMDLLAQLTPEDLDRMPIPVGPRRRILNALGLLRAHGAETVPEAETAAAEIWSGALEERRQVTAVFCDVVDWVERSTRLKDDEVLRRLQVQFHQSCERVAARYGVRIAEKPGDGILVYFGWPEAQEDGAQGAVRFALDLQQTMTAIPAEPPLSMRIGVATGTVIVSREDAGQMPATGVTPSLAARLQAVAQAGEIVVSQSTRELLGESFELVDRGSRELKGFRDSVRIWRVAGIREEFCRFEAAHGAGLLTPLVAREEELRALTRRWQQACDGQGRVELLVGEPGIGKSRLVQAFRERMALAGQLTLRYQCSPYHSNSALYPVARQIIQAAGVQHGDADDVKLDKMEATLLGGEEQARDTAALMAALLGLPLDRYPALDKDPVRLRERTLEALRTQLELHAQRSPVLMVVEDVHWIDPSSQSLLDDLVPQIHDLPIMLIVTFRPEYVSPWLRQSHVHLLHLERLSQSEAANMTEQVAGKPLPDALVSRIVTQTDGVPLFVEELTKSMLESGALVDTGRRFEPRHYDGAISVPATLRDSLLARLDRLGSAKYVVQTGACIGRTFGFSLLARIVPVGADALREALKHLLQSGLLHHNSTRDGILYTFKHALIQEAAYESLLASHRQHLHARIAQVLETDFPDQSANEPELLAQHYTLAGVADKAVQRWRDAGLLALRRGAPREAVAHFQRGLELMEKLSTSTERDDLELSMREPLNAALTSLSGWATPEVTDNARVILNLNQRHGRAANMRLGLWAIWVNTVTQGRVADSLEWCDRLLEAGAGNKDLDLEIFGHGASMISHFCLGNLLQARFHGEQVLDRYDSAQASRWMEITAHDMRTLVGVWAGQWTWMLGFPDQAVRLCSERDAYARVLGDSFNLGFSLSLGSYVFDYRCEPQVLQSRVLEAADSDAGRPAPFVKQVMARQLEGLALLRAGEYEQAAKALRSALHDWHSLGGHSRTPYLKAALAEARARSGHLGEGLALIAECLEQIDKAGWQERSHFAEVLRLKGWILKRRGDRIAAEAALRASIDWARTQRAKSWELRSATTLAELLLESERRDEARGVLAPVLAWFTEGHDTHDHRAARAVLQLTN